MRGAMLLILKYEVMVVLHVQDIVIFERLRIDI